MKNIATRWSFQKEGLIDVGERACFTTGRVLENSVVRTRIVELYELYIRTSLVHIIAIIIGICIKFKVYGKVGTCLR